MRWRWLLGIIVLSCSILGWAQVKTDSAALLSGAVTWQVFGRVLTARGRPVSDVVVQVDAGPTARLSVRTNIQGEFRTEIKLDLAKSDRLRGTVVASKTGFIEGRETFDFGINEGSSRIDIVLRERNEDPDQISITTLVGVVAPILRDNATKKIIDETARNELIGGCEKLISQHDGIAAAPLLRTSVERTANCPECRLLLALAMMNSGSWSGAEKELEQASKADEASAAKRPEPALLTGILQSWRGRDSDAARSFLRALDADPKNPLALQELGRTLLTLKNWESADQYLEKALQAGAGDVARLLRVRALLEFGDTAEAAREMDLYVGARVIKDLRPADRALWIEVQERLSLLSYRQLRSVITQSPEELVEALPTLQGLRPAADQSTLEEILQKTGSGVEAFLKNFPNTASVEQVHQERLGKDGKIRDSLDQEFQYLMLAHPERAALGIEEHRSTEDGQDATLVGLHKGLMLTKGFASASSIFHPINRRGADFRYLGMQDIEGQETHVIAFAQKPETAKMVTRFITDNRTALILVQGLAWIDAGSFHIIRLYTGLLNPLPTVRLQRQTTEIRFRQVPFGGGSTTLWLPEEVMVMVDWKGRTYRNWHRYSNFKLFNVDAREVGKPRQKNKAVFPE